jgi:hypothetical protein
VWDGETPWTPEEGEVVEIPVGSFAGIGWDYVNGEFVDNRPVEDEDDEWAGYKTLGPRDVL